MKQITEIVEKFLQQDALIEENDKSDLLNLLSVDDSKIENTLSPDKGAQNITPSANFEEDQNVSKVRVNDNQVAPEETKGAT